MPRRNKGLVCSAVVPMVLARLGWAQTFEKAWTPRSASSEADFDPMLAMQLRIAGRKQIAVCELPIKKLQDEKLRDDGVKKFAQAEIDEHVSRKRKLKQLALEHRVESEDRPEDAAAPLNQMSQARFRANGQHLPPTMTTCLLIDSYQLAIRSNLNALRRERLRWRSGLPDAIDHRFFENQWDAHHDLFDQGVIFSKHASQTLMTALMNPVPSSRSILPAAKSCVSSWHRLIANN